MKIPERLRKSGVAVRNWWWYRQRQIDLKILWPACKKAAPNMDLAKAAFAHHAFKDPAWVDYYGEDGLKQEIDKLE